MNPALSLNCFSNASTSEINISSPNQPNGRDLWEILKGKQQVSMICERLWHDCDKETKYQLVEQHIRCYPERKFSISEKNGDKTIKKEWFQHVKEEVLVEPFESGVSSFFSMVYSNGKPIIGVIHPLGTTIESKDYENKKKTVSYEKIDALVDDEIRRTGRSIPTISQIDELFDRFMYCRAYRFKEEAPIQQCVSKVDKLELEKLLTDLGINK
ncbi:hypothetical protein AB4179_19605 [Vibrio lentus]|uniref:hypothetical protein n=1 Tax=Vibrio lentus TaxID=136468 RepID=UPI0024699ED2|nr:hypothetical protein [Vibrio lentus]MDH5928666.1 hypothetical protein [Vibrio lentus]